MNDLASGRPGRVMERAPGGAGARSAIRTGYGPTSRVTMFAGSVAVVTAKNAAVLPRFGGRGRKAIRSATLAFSALPVPFAGTAR
jgi:hypothetical protein